MGKVFAFHSSHDGQWWDLIRVFTLESDDALQIGFEAQAPTGDGCEVEFDDIAFVQETLSDLRDGS